MAYTQGRQVQQSLRGYPTQSLRGYPTQPLRGLFSSAAENRATDLLGGSQGGGPISFDIDSRFRVFNKNEFPPAPFLVEVQAAAPGILTIFSPSAGILWDDATKLAAPAQVVKNGSSSFFRIDEVKGNQLEVWVDDPLRMFDAKLLPLQEGQKKRQEQSAKEQEATNPQTVLVSAGAAAIIIYAIASALRR